MLKGGKGSVNGRLRQPLFTYPLPGHRHPSERAESGDRRPEGYRFGILFGLRFPLSGFRTLARRSHDRYARGVSSRALVVSLHDVSPHTHKACGRIMRELEEIGVRRVSLLVIPDHHGRGHFLKAPDFCTWLQDRAAEGHEI